MFLRTCRLTQSERQHNEKRKMIERSRLADPTLYPTYEQNQDIPPMNRIRDDPWTNAKFLFREENPKSRKPKEAAFMMLA